MFYQAEKEWASKIQGWRDALGLVKVPNDIEPSQGKLILSQLDALYSDIRITYGDINKMYEEVESLVERVRRKAEKLGSNTEARKASGIQAVENAERGDGQTVNLYNVRTELLHKKEDLKSLLDVINQKQSMVITMSGLLKIESTIAGH